MSYSPASQPPADPMELAWEGYLQNLFAFSFLTVRQKVLAMTPKYHIHDEQDRPRFYVVRAPQWAGTIVAGAASFLVGIVVMVLTFRLMMSGHYWPGFLTATVGGYLSLSVRLMLRPLRDIYIYTDESESIRVLTIRQDTQFGIHQWFTLFDARGGEVARLRRSALRSMWHRRWVAMTLDGQLIGEIREDSVTLALVRRYLGALWGALRTNFDILLPNGVRVGEYNRKLTLTDQYILDLSGDPWFLLDRRVALAMSILLDTGERR